MTTDGPPPSTTRETATAITTRALNDVFRALDLIDGAAAIRSALGDDVAAERRAALDMKRAALRLAGADEGFVE